jgi:hypothetical protein
MMAGFAGQLIYFGPVYAILHGTVDPRMRATAVAVALLVTNLVGYGLGPPIIGAVSDALTRQMTLRSPAILYICGSGSWLEQACRSPQAGGLQWALTLLTVANLWNFYHLLQVSRNAAADARSNHQ